MFERNAKRRPLQIESFVEVSMGTLEPVAVINGAISIVEAAIALAVGFGLGWTAEQVGLVMALVVALGNVVKTFWSRSQVTPVSSPRDTQGKPLVTAA